jgi:TonB family protein
LHVLDTDYPFESLLANEQGTVSLNLLVDPGGRVYFVQVLASSGAPRLDQAAAQIARAKWRFDPTTRGGNAIMGAVLVDVAWKLPLRPADAFYSEMMGFSISGKSIVEPKPIPETQRVRVGDYPAVSIRDGEQGEAALRLRVLEDGTVGSAEILDSSGYSRLDQAALAYARRVTYEPGMVDGTPVAMGFDVTVDFLLTDNPRSGPPPLPRFCHSRPILGPSTRMASAGNSNGVRVAQWIHAEGGTIDDVLLLTNSGWMHVSAPIVETYKATVNIRPGVARNPSSGSLIPGRRRSSSCWYRGDVTVQAS